MNAYAVARARGRHIYEALVEEDRALLATFGLDLISVGAGLRLVPKKEGRTSVAPWEVINIELKTWKVFRPLLMQLRDFQQHQLPSVLLDAVAERGPAVAAK